MLADLKEYRPAKIDFVLDDKVKEEFKDVMVLCKGAKSSKELFVPRGRIGNSSV